MLGAVGDVHAAHYFLDAVFAFRRAHFEVGQRQFDVFIDVELVDEVETLEDEADVALAELRAVLLFEVRHLLTEEFVTALGRVVQEAEDVHQRRFAAARRAHDCHKFAVLDFKCRVVEGDGFHLVGAEDS